MDLAEFVDSFYAPAHLGIQPKSLDQLRFAVAIYSRWLGHPATLADFDEHPIREWLSSLVGKVSPVTVNSKRRIILSLWRAAFEEELVGRPPRTSKVKAMRAPRQQPLAWTVEEVGRLLNAAGRRQGDVAGIQAGFWWRSLLACAYDSGARKSELMRLRCRDLSIDQGWMVIVRQKQGTPRVCRLAEDTIDACRWVWSKDRDLMWPNPFSESNFYLTFRQIAKDAGVEAGQGKGGCLHRFRRTCATLTEANGGQGHIAIGDDRRTFEKHYLDDRKLPSQISYLPRPR